MVDRASEQIPQDWRAAISRYLTPGQLAEAESHANVETDDGRPVYPPVGQRFEAMRCTPLAEVKAVILGQDPYHEAGQAHGLAFSTMASKWPPSLRNIICEWHLDTGLPCPENGSLERWARHGVLLLNTALTVRDGKANDHASRWPGFTKAIIQTVSAKPEAIAFLLWGAPAIKCGRDIAAHHLILPSSHPSPLSADRPCADAPAFIGSRPFTGANRQLAELGMQPIDWSLG
jgi:uracil-DNA glycosylase